MPPETNLIYSHRIEVRFRDCDSFGHVNNAVYFTFFEQARVMMGERLGLNQLLGRVSLILVHASCDYKAQVVFGDELEVSVGVASLGRSSFTYELVARRVGDGTVVATGNSVHAVFDYQTGRTLPMPAPFRAELARLMAGEPAAS